MRLRRAGIQEQNGRGSGDVVFTYLLRYLVECDEAFGIVSLYHSLH